MALSLNTIHLSFQDSQSLFLEKQAVYVKWIPRLSAGCFETRALSLLLIISFTEKYAKLLCL